MAFIIRFSQAKSPAVIALLAILMMFIAPDLSRHLQSQPAHLPPALASGNMHTMPDGDITSATAATVTPHTQGNGMETAVCGYCALLVHMPLLLVVQFSLCGLALLRPPARVRRTLPMPAGLFFAGELQPRAPPSCQ
ncbi:hypothetical protein GCM10009414_01220 [Tatumella terrea]|uniref:DUF2946 domain-containing protein n=1 Tax=Tatumella terrea TaxID=419007 RepID=UPI0031E47A99